MKLIQRASNGDESTVPALQEWLRAAPEMVESFGGDLPGQVERQLVESLAANNLAFREAVHRKVEMLRDEIAGPKPTVLERLLIERVVLAWLRLYEAELRNANLPDTPSSAAKYREGRLEGLSRQFLTAVKTLATVRKLAIPVLVGQINVAGRQVNQVTTQVA